MEFENNPAAAAGSGMLSHRPGLSDWLRERVLVIRPSTFRAKGLLFLAKLCVRILMFSSWYIYCELATIR